MTTRDENIKLIAEELKERGIKEVKWPGRVIATQDPELPKGIYENLIKNCGGEIIKLGNGGTTFDPIAAFTKLPDEVKDKLTAEAIKIIEGYEAGQDPDFTKMNAAKAKS